MNSIFHDKLDEFVIIYINDILVYSKFVEEHVTYLEFLLQKFKNNKLYVNKVKSEFTSLKMDFLGHVLSQEGVRLNPKNIQSIKKWRRSMSAKGVRSFLRLANFYKRFIKDFSTLVKLLTNLLKKERLFEWKRKQEKTFEFLKGKLLVALVLSFLDSTKPFKVHTNANGSAIGGVFMQGHPIAFENKKLVGA